MNKKLKFFFLLTRWLVGSQMKPTEARRAFPCFDEPAMKAQFKLTVTHHQSLKAISNMPSNNVLLMLRAKLLIKTQ